MFFYCFCWQLSESRVEDLLPSVLLNDRGARFECAAHQNDFYANLCDVTAAQFAVPWFQATLRDRGDFDMSPLLLREAQYRTVNLWASFAPFRDSAQHGFARAEPVRLRQPIIGVQARRIRLKPTPD